MKIMKRDSTTPMMFQDLSPPPLKPVPHNAGYVKLLWEGGKLKKIKEMHVNQAEIYEAMYRQVKAKSDSIYETMTLGVRIDMVHKEADHRKIMMKHEQTKGEAEAVNAHYEARISEYEFKMREREFKKMMDADGEE